MAKRVIDARLIKFSRHNFEYITYHDAVSNELIFPEQDEGANAEYEEEEYFADEVNLGM
jgi:hypothetical protein